MRFGKVVIDNYRSIDHLEIDLQGYSVLFGANNSGKSNLIEALLFYFDQIKPNPDVFHCVRETKADDLWIEMEYIADDEAELAELPEKYRLANNTYRVRRSLEATSMKPIYAGYIIVDGEEILDDVEFFGAKNVSKSKLGEVVYVPALRDIALETKTQGTSLFAKLLKDIIGEDLKSRPEFTEIVTAIDVLSTSLRGEVVENREDRDYSCLANIEKTIEEELSLWDCGVKISLEAPEAKALIQQSANIRIAEKDNPPRVPQEMGHGLQRSLLIALIKTWAEVERKAVAKKQKGKKTYRPDLSLILFEEPEIYLAPPLQKSLYSDLEQISQIGNTQVVVSTHSSIFLSGAEDNFKSLVRVLRNVSTTVCQVSDQFITSLADEPTKRRFRFRLWLNSDRNEAFFSDRVVLVEGATEKAIYQWLSKSHKDVSGKRSCTIIDCGGKTNIPFFMKLFSDLKIQHYVVHDDDNNKNQMHINANNAIAAASNDFTEAIEVVAGDIESYLGLPKVDSYKKASEALYNLEENGIEDTKEAVLLKALQF